MIKVVATNYVKEECLDEFLALAKEIVELTNAKDKGLIKYEFCRNTQNPLNFAMLEEWESIDALKEHMKAEHFLRIIPQFDSCCKEGGEVMLFEKMF